MSRAEIRARLVAARRIVPGVACGFSSKAHAAKALRKHDESLQKMSNDTFELLFEGIASLPTARRVAVLQRMPRLAAAVAASYFETGAVGA